MQLEIEQPAFVDGGKSLAGDSLTGQGVEQITLIGIGAGGGGLPALLAFIQNLPTDAGLAYVVVAPSAITRRALARIQQASALPVVEVKAEVTLDVDTLYLVAPGYSTELSGNLLQPFQLASGQRTSTPLDGFFAALARERAANAVAVLLAGRGKDGVAGLAAIKEQGGWTFVQSPEGAEQPALLRRALAAMVAAVTAGAAELAELLVKQVGLLAERATSPVFASPPDAALAEIRSHIHQQLGHDFGPYKESMLLRRITRRMQIVNLNDPARFQELLRNDPQQTRLLYKDFLVSVTSFFRDPDAFDMLGRECIPHLFPEKSPQETVRVWVVGCATGEEAYSVAILLAEQAATLANPPRLQVFASDVDEEAIDFARRALYPHAVAEDMTPARVEKYFVREEAGYRVKPQIRETVLFAVHNVLKDPPFSRIDLICCRNLLIYFRQEAQIQVLEQFRYALNPNGYLFLGTAESADSVKQLFSIRNKRCHLYQRRELSGGARPIAHTGLNGATMRLAPARLRPEARRMRSLEELYEGWTLRQYAPPRLLIDERQDITHIFGGADRYLYHREGAVTQNVLQKVLPALRFDLQTLLSAALAHGERGRSRWISLEIDHAPRMIQLVVGPVEEQEFPKNIIEVVFFEQEDTLANKPVTALRESGDSTLIDQLQAEVLHTRERLQATIEEHHTASQELIASNEELQSINEELRSTTEELEINKEELQSMNEELETANYELKHSIDELSRTHSDLLNFITSTEVGVIFLDRGLRIKRFTPRTVDLFHLIEGDIGRPLAHVTHRLRYTRLAEQAAHVLDQLEELELLVQSEDERWYIARLLPYRTIEDQIDGVVLTFIDVTDLKRAEYEVQQRIQQQTVAELGRLALAERSLEPILAAATARVAEVLEVDICQLLELQPDGESLLLTAGKGFRPGYVGQVHVPVSPRLQVGYTLQVGQPVVLQSVRQEVKFGLADHLVEHQIVSGVTVAISSGDRAFGVLGAYSVKERTYSQFDIDFLQSVANLLAAAMARRTAEVQIHFQARLLDAVEQAVIAVNREFKITYWNRFAEHLYGWSAQEVLGRALADIIIPPDQRTLAGGIRQQLRAGESWAGEFMMRRRNGEIFPAYVTDSPIFNGTGELVGTVGVSFDISDRKQVEKSLRESEQRFRTMADTAPVLIWTAGPDGLCDFFNQPWLTFTGRTMEASLGKGWSEDLHPEDYERCLSTNRTAFASRQPYTMEFRLRRQDGEYRWIVDNAVPRFDGEHFAGYIGSCIDIHDRKTAEADAAFLAELSEQMRQAEEAEALIVTVTRMVGDYLDATYCALAELDEAQGAVTIWSDDARDRVTQAGSEQLAEFKTVLIDELRRGQPVAIADARRDPRTAADYGASYQPLGIVAYAGAPLLHDGHLQASLSVVADQPRRWQQHQAALLQTVVERLWSAVEKLRAEAELRASEAELRLITNTVPGLIAYVDAHQQYQFVNSAYEQWFARPTAAIIGHPMQELLGETVYQRKQPHILAALAGEFVTFEDDILYPDGPRTVQITYIPDRAPDGRVAGFYSLIIDITERTRAEKALRYLADASVALANSLDYESTLDMVARLAVPAIADWCTIDLLSEDGQLELVSVAHMDPAKVAWGYELRRRYPMDPNAPVGAPLVMRTGQPEFYPIITDELLQAISKTPEDLALLRSIGYSSVMIVPLRTRDRALGTITFVATESRRHFSEADLAIAEEIARRAATSIDNALLFRAVQTREQELRASEERSQQQLAELQLVYATAPVGLAVLDRQQRYLRVNETLAAMNGYAAEEHLGKTGRDLFPGIAEQAEHLVQQVLETGQPVVNVEISGETPAFPGAPRIWLESFYPLRSPDGVIVGINAVVQDITERKQQEAELKALNETLERRVEERTAELARSNRELDQFAYVASHDLKAPLRNIAQLAAWISEDANGQLPPTAQGHLARMQSRILRMNTLLDDLLTYSRAGRLNDALNQVTLATLLHDIVETLAPPPDFKIQLTSSAPVIRTERVPLETVLRNLIGNALKHHHQTDGNITIALDKRDGWWEFAVSDDGPGIDPQFYERIFELFQTLQPRDKVEGSGMGLAIVRRIVETRGGKVAVDATPGGGATFRFSWPLSE